jgi:hypothetical protein
VLVGGRSVSVGAGVDGPLVTVGPEVAVAGADVLSRRAAAESVSPHEWPVQRVGDGDRVGRRTLRARRPGRLVGPVGCRP